MPPPPASSTCAYRLKALVLCAYALGGKDGGRKFEEAAGIARSFDDETVLISRLLWVNALEVFSEQFGSVGFRALPPYIVHPQNLAFWSPLLRNAKHPGSVYSHLADGAGAHEQLSEWREEERAPQMRRLSTPLPEQEAKTRKLVVSALTAELEAVPLLFARPRAKIGATVFDSGRVTLEARFDPPPKTFGGVGVLGTLLGVGSAASAALLLRASTAEVGLVMGAGGAMAGVVAWALGRDAAHRSAAHFQKTRIVALEREARVRRDQTSDISPSRQESLIAGEYRIGEQLGVGGASAVWEAHRVSDGRPVAIKLLRTAMASDSRASDRLQREAEALGLSWHPHVVKVHDHGLLPSGLGYLVMERLRGETLSARVRRLRALSREEVIRFGIQAAEALFAVHQAGIVHRDIKPANLFVHRDASGEVLKLFDFGVAHVNWAETRLTRDGAAIGTPGYAAPEQEDGAPSHPAADLYALGVSLQELLTGDLPSSTGSARRLRASRPPPEEEQGPSREGQRPALEQLLLEMTAFEPADRPADAREVAGRLRALLVQAEGEPPPASAVPQETQTSSEPEVPARTGSDRP